MKHKTNLQKINDFLKQIDADYSYYDVICINTKDPYNPTLALRRAVLVDVLQGFLCKISKGYIIYHISLSSTYSSEIVIILR